MDFRGRLPGWVDRWGPAALRKRELEIGPRAFAQGYRMRPYASEELAFPHFERALELGLRESIPEPLPRDWVRFVGVDLSSAKRPGNVAFAAAVDAHGVRRPLDVVRIKGSSPAVARAIGGVVERWRPQAVVVENNGYQAALEEWVRELGGRFPWWPLIVPFLTGSNKADPVLGLPGLDVEFANGAWVVPRELNPRANGHPLYCECGPCVWVAETLAYPHGRATDTVMAMWFCREGIRGWLESAASRGEDELVAPRRRGEFFDGIPEDEIA